MTSPGVPGAYRGDLPPKKGPDVATKNALTTMDEAARAASGRRVALRFDRIEAALGLEPLPQDTYHKVYDIPTGD
jgi:hypothetical protein